ncbi:MAG: hypothetical protein Q7J78_02500 [Clostridiales bacterium]|nr:hypothetical protein [Clostridiales bacterium]
MNIYEASFKGQPSIVMKNNYLRLEVLPRGGRIVSLIDKKSGREFLVQQKGDEYCAGTYGSNMVEYQPAGFDDMFPTINECFYEDYPWEGHKMPDHGEVWSLNWKHEIKKDQLSLWVYGVRLPYLFIKTIRFSEENQVNISYKAENLSEFDMYFLWAAHPMLKAEESLEILLPDDCSKAVCTLCFSGRLGEYGDIFDWPEWVDKSSVKHKVNKLRGLNTGNTEKYYFKDRLSQGWCKIKYPSDNTILTLAFPVEKVPYFGILVEEGGWADELYVIPEPCTAPFDRIDVSKLHSKSAAIPGNGLYEWYLGITVDANSEL